MSGPQELILAKAAKAFTSGNYVEARQLYQRASARYGEDLFAESIALCDRLLQRMGAGETQGGEPPGGGCPNATGVPVSEGAVARQLQETQALLEKYYTRCQELEHRALDRALPNVTDAVAPTE